MKRRISLSLYQLSTLVEAIDSLLAVGVPLEENPFICLVYESLRLFERRLLTVINRLTFERRDQTTMQVTELETQTFRCLIQMMPDSDYAHLFFHLAYPYYVQKKNKPKRP